MASHPKYNPIENISHYKSILAQSNYVTTSTPYLAERLRQWVRCPIELLPNTVEVAKFAPRPVKESGVPTVGWVGSTAHRSGDLGVVKGVLGPMFEDGLIKVHHSGYNSQHPLFADEIGMHPKLVSLLPMAAPSEYPKLFTFDVGIVPLTDTPFNRAKSAIKGLEYAAAGIPFVASNLDAYADLASNGIGLVAKKNRYWRILLERLCDPSFRLSESEKNRELVANYDVQYGVKAMTEFLESVGS